VVRQGYRRAGYPRRPPAASTTATMAAWIEVGRSDQAAATRARSGLPGGGEKGQESACDEDGTTVGTSPFPDWRKSFTGIEVTASGLQSTEPKVTGSIPVGCMPSCRNDLRQFFRPRLARPP